MLRLFLQPSSWFVKLSELALLFLIGFLANDLLSGHLSFFQASFFLLLFLLFATNKACTMKRWYAHALPGAGIERHFLTSWMLSVYFFLSAALLFLLWRNAFVFFIACLPLTFLTHFHPVLIAFHLKDRSLEAPNAFSHDAGLTKL